MLIRLTVLEFEELQPAVDDMNVVSAKRSSDAHDHTTNSPSACHLNILNHSENILSVDIIVGCAVRRRFSRANSENECATLTWVVFFVQTLLPSHGSKLLNECQHG